MNKSHENKEAPLVNKKKVLPLDRIGSDKKPYETPALSKLGDIAALTNVSVIV